VVIGTRGRVEVPADAEALPGIEKFVVEPRGYVSGSATFLFGANGDRRPVQIAARDHEDVVAGGAVVPGEDVCREVGADDLADV